jgi:hypothetical protein
MEARLLLTETDKRLFASNLVKTRTMKGAGFSETKRSHVGEAHLAFGQLYGIYDEQGPAPDEMFAGFVLHDLSTFPQSYPKPDLTHFPPETVFECGELWASTAGGAHVARQAIWILLGVFGAKALVAYPIFKPWNLTLAYRRNFAHVEEPIEWPYACTNDGDKIFVKAIVSENDNLRHLIEEGTQYGFEIYRNAEVVRFHSPHPLFRKTLSAAPPLARKTATSLDHVLA